MAPSVASFCRTDGVRGGSVEKLRDKTVGSSAATLAADTEATRELRRDPPDPSLLTARLLRKLPLLSLP